MSFSYSAKKKGLLKSSQLLFSIMELNFEILEAKSNQSETEFWTKSKEKWDQSPAVVISMVTLTFLFETVGNLGLFCIIKFEKCGRDTLKRNVTNQLTSSLCAVGIVNQTLLAPGLFYSILIGPLNTFFGLWTHYGCLMTLLFGIFTVTEQVVLRCLYISYFSRLAPVSDYFIATFLNCFNFLIVFYITLMCVGIQEYKTDPYTNFMIENPKPFSLSFHDTFVFL